jgi:hypothetical protein
MLYLCPFERAGYRLRAGLDRLRLGLFGRFGRSVDRRPGDGLGGSPGFGVRFRFDRGFDLGRRPRAGVGRRSAVGLGRSLGFGVSGWFVLRFGFTFRLGFGVGRAIGVGRHPAGPFAHANHRRRASIGGLVGAFDPVERSPRGSFGRSCVVGVGRVINGVDRRRGRSLVAAYLVGRRSVRGSAERKVGRGLNPYNNRPHDDTARRPRAG